jgi:hypothetical protein
MHIRRLLLILPLALLLGACTDPTGPRIPDEPDGSGDPPDTSAYVVSGSALA